MPDDSRSGDLVIRSPEWRWRLAMLGAAGCTELWRAVTGGTDGYVVLAILAVAAWRVFRSRLVVTPEGLDDIGLLRRQTIRWPVVDGFGVSRSSRWWPGYCIAVSCGDRTVDLASLRAYVLVPSRRHLEELHRIAGMLQSTLVARDGLP